MQKPGYVLPGSQEAVTAGKVSGVKNEGRLCNAVDVGWVDSGSSELLVIDEAWHLISGDACPMAPPPVRLGSSPQQSCQLSVPVKMYR